MFKNILLSLTMFSLFAEANFTQLSAMDKIKIDESCSSSSGELHGTDYVQLQSGKLLKINEENASKHSEFFCTRFSTEIPAPEFLQLFDGKNGVITFKDEVVEFVMSLINDNKIFEHKLLHNKPKNIQWIDIWVFADFIMCKEISNILLPKMIKLKSEDLPSSTKLNLTIFHPNNIQPTINFLENNPNIYITSLNLSRLNITDTQFETILNAGNFRQSLKKLSLFLCKNLQNINLGSLPNLETLDLFGSNINDAQLEKILNDGNFGQSLKKLSLFLCKNLQNINLGNLPNLETLDLCSLNINDAQLENILNDGNFRQSLKKLSLLECTNLQNINLGSFPNLETLDLSGSKINNVQFETILNAKNFRQSLKKLNLSWCANLQNINLGSLPNLETLDLYSSSINDAQLEKILNDGNFRQSLKELDLSYCANLQNINLGSLPNLKRLSLLDSEINDAQLEKILNDGNFRQSLKKLSLSSCTNLQNINLSSLPNLKNIDLSLDVSLQTVKLSSKFKDFNLKQKYPSTNFIYID